MTIFTRMVVELGPNRFPRSRQGKLLPIVNGARWSKAGWRRVRRHRTTFWVSPCVRLPGTATAPGSLLRAMSRSCGRLVVTCSTDPTSFSPAAAATTAFTSTRLTHTCVDISDIRGIETMGFSDLFMPVGWSAPYLAAPTNHQTDTT